jgi:hypothetical protein
MRPRHPLVALVALVARVARVAPVAIAALAALLCLLTPRRAEAYPWMIRHEYTGCGQCHADPSGGGLLTLYGRAQSELLLRTRYGHKASAPVPAPAPAPAEGEGDSDFDADDAGGPAGGPSGGAESEADEPSKASGFLWGAFESPDWLLLGGSIRGLALRVAPSGAPADSRFVQMQADLRGQIAVGGLRVNASVGFMHAGAQPAWLTRSGENNLVSREHWVGYAWGEEAQMMLRAGRLNLPFGIRDIQHTLWVRTQTRTDINDGQQHGAAFAYTGDTFRGEVMAIAGNYQVTPDAYRERGYSGYIEAAIAPRTAVGLSSLATHASRQPLYHLEGTRMAHGLFARYAPVLPLVLMAEADAIIFLPSSGDARKGYAGYVQADLEFTRGVHAIATGEAMNPGGQQAGTSYGGWASLAWFFAPHADVRLDAIEQTMPAGPSRQNVLSLLAQFHVFL